MDVAEAAVGLLQVGLEQEGDVAVGRVALVDLVGQHRQPAAGSDRQWSSAWSSIGLDDRAVAGHHPPVEEPELGPEILGRRPRRTSAGRRTEWSSRMPSSHTGYQTASAMAPDVAPPVVDEHHVEVAAGAQLAPAVATHGHEGEAVGVAVGRAFEQPGQPAVGGRRQGGAEGVAVQVRCGQKLLAQRRSDGRDTGDGTTRRRRTPVHRAEVPGALTWKERVIGVPWRWRPEVRRTRPRRLR